VNNPRFPDNIRIFPKPAVMRAEVPGELNGAVAFAFPWRQAGNRQVNVVLFPSSLAVLTRP
jgi:hypothetical protein